MKINWKTETRKIQDLVPSEYNPRKLTKLQEQNLSNSLTNFNLAVPIVININNKIIGGHQRFSILKKRGLPEIEVRVPDRELNEKEEKELNLRLNKNLGEWDFDMLLNFDPNILNEVGFTDEELAGANIIDDIELPAGEKAGFQQMTFILSDEQVEQVKEAIKKSKEMGEFVDTGNKNSNGNALARICETFNGNS